MLENPLHRYTGLYGESTATPFMRNGIAQNIRYRSPQIHYGYGGDVRDRRLGNPLRIRYTFQG